MPRGRAENESSVSLHLAASPRVGLESVILPWFERAARGCLEHAEPTIVAVPFRSQAYALKRSLLEHGLSLFGLRFVTPAQLRELLTDPAQTNLALREHLRLLLATAAEECMKLPEDSAEQTARMLDPDYLAAKSVRRAPDHLLRTLDQLGAAGWNFSDLNLPSLAQIVRQFHRRLDLCGFELIHAVDRRALDEAKKSPPLFANILVTGFNAAHWPLWPLLRAAVAASSEAAVLLEDPRDEARDLDEAWVGTWEESFGEAKPAAPRATASPPGEALFSEAEMRGEGSFETKRSFLVGANTVEQAEAVAQQCVQFLSQPDCTNVGIIFSTSGALPRLVTDALTRLKIPHHDGLAHFQPGPFEAADWRAWLELQQSPRTNALLQFINALPNREELFPQLRSSFERTIRSAYADLLVDDLEILERYCASDPGENRQAAAAVLKSVSFLPARARFTTFLGETKKAFDAFSWSERWAELSRHLGPWVEKLPGEFSRGLFLRWVGEIASTLSAARAPEGDHPYARIQLLTVPQAQNQEWSHLIFAGWNEGAWPTRETGDFARQEEIDAFNRGIRTINKRAVRQGRQGEGHTVIRPGHTIYLGAAEQRQIELRQFEALVESVRQEITFGASLIMEDAPERLWNPSELFTRAYQEARNATLTQSAMNRLHAETRSRLDGARSERETAKGKEQTRIAYDARRDPNSRSGEYDFAFRSAPPRVPTLSVSDFEQLISASALIWMKKYLGVKAPEENINVWNTSSGKWVHDWLAAIVTAQERTFSALPSAAEAAERICAAAEAKREQVSALCRAVGKSLPDWWSGGWRNALFLARALGERLDAAQDWPNLATEWKVEGEFPVDGTDAILSLTGRIDLLLARAAPGPQSLKTPELWIIDYKTGAKKPLKPGALNAEGRRPTLKKLLLDGSAVQLGLYAVAARALGADVVHVSFLSPLVRPLQPQISASDFASEKEIFVALAEMQQSGVFGMHGQLRSNWRFTDDYPLATLAIDNDILEERWELTHPALVRDEEEPFW